MDSTANKPALKIKLRLTAGLMFVILLALLINAVAMFRTNGIVDDKIAEAKEAARPADIEIIKITAPDCADCFDINPAINLIKQENVTVKTEQQFELTSPEGKALIAQYNITKAPAFIITGEIEKGARLTELWQKIGQIREGAFIFRQIGSPYVLTSNGQVKGRVSISLIRDQACGQCYDVNVHERILAQYGLPTQDKQLLEASQDQARLLIEKYRIKLLPTIVLTGDLASFSSLTKVWPQVGSSEADGAYIFRDGVKQMGTYRDLTTGEIVIPASQTSQAAGQAE